MAARPFALLVVALLALLAAAWWMIMPRGALPTGEARFERLEKATDVQLLDAATDADPATRAAAFYHLALRAHRKGERKLAEEFLGQSIAAELVGAYSALSAYELAKIHEAAWRAKPEEEKERLAQALELYRRFLKLYKGQAKTPHALHRAALLHIGLNEHDRAAECFEALLADWKDFPELPSTVLAYAGSLTLAARFDACIDLITRHLERWKEDAAFRPRALLALAFAREMAGRREDARADYQAILRDSPASPEAQMAKSTLERWK